MTVTHPSTIIRHIVSACVSQRRRFADLAVVLVLLVIADGIVSQYLTAQGLGWESNPFLRRLTENGFLLVKVAGAIAVGALLLDLYRRRPKIASFSTVFFVGVYTAIVYWNLGILLLARGATI